MASKKTNLPSKRKNEPTVESSYKKFDISRINIFASEVKSEFSKVVWPDKRRRQSPEPGGGRSFWDRQSQRPNSSG